MKSINVPMQITSFAWADADAPPSPTPMQGKEDFMFTTYVSRFCSACRCC